MNKKKLTLLIALSIIIITTVTTFIVDAVKPETIVEEPIKETIPEKTNFQEEKQENPQNNEDFLIEKNKEKEQEIKARLGLVKSSLIMKNIKEKEGKNNE